MANPVQFLWDQWSRVCQEGDYVFLATLDREKKRWHDASFPFDNTTRRRLRDWLRQNPATEKDIYWCPAPFSEPKRDERYAQPVNLFWSDIDDGDQNKIKPSVLWESSPGRHHGLWYIDSTIDALEAGDISRTLTHHIGADPGGWDSTQVLRIPGTYNHKYDHKPEVKLVSNNKKVYDVNKLAKRISYVPGEHTVEKLELEEGDYDETLEKYNLPQKLVDKLEEDSDGYDRSEMIFKLSCQLAERGVEPDDIYTLIKHSDWNKYAGKIGEKSNLTRDISKAVDKVGKNSKVNVKGRKTRKKKAEGEDRFTVISIDEMVEAPYKETNWMVDGIWQQSSFGMISGEPKSFKSVIAMDVGISVASGKPFMGKHEVMQQGKVLYIDNENGHNIMNDRAKKMMAAKDLGRTLNRGKKFKPHKPGLPFFMISVEELKLNNEEDQDWLEEWIKKEEPTLVIIDPLYRSFNGDMSSAEEVGVVTDYLHYLHTEYGVGIMLVHHSRKGGDNKRGGQNVYGTTFLHGWNESGLYLQADRTDDPEWGTVIMEREFRGAALRDKLEIQIGMGDMGDMRYETKIDDYFEPEQQGRKVKTETIEVEVIRALANRTDRTMNMTQLVRETGCNEKQLDEVLQSMCGDGRIEKNKGNYTLKEQK